MIIVFGLVAPIVAESSADAVQLGFNEKIRIGDLLLYFYDIEDSRCPLDVICIWEGRVIAMIKVQNQTHEISGNFTPGYTLSYITPYNVTLVDVLPHPISTEKPDYVAVLDISKQPDRDSLQKGETLDDSLGWLVLGGFSVIIIAFVVMKIKKRK